LMHGKGAQILEAAICAGVDVSCLCGCHAGDLDLTLDALQERAVVGQQRKTAMLLRRYGAAGTFKGMVTACMLFKMIVDKWGQRCFFLDPCCLEIAIDLGVDLRAVRVNPAYAMEFACLLHRRNKHQRFSATIYELQLEDRGSERTLLEMAIFCGQDLVASKLVSLGCDAGGVTLTNLHTFGIFFRDFQPDRYTRAFEALKHVYQRERSKYGPLILQLAHWWRRVPSGSGGSNIVVQHMGIVELIAQFALAIPILPGVLQHHPQLAIQEAGFDDAVQEGEPELVVVEPLIETSAQLEHVAEIDPAEAAAVAEDCGSRRCKPK